MVDYWAEMLAHLKVGMKAVCLAVLMVDALDLQMVVCSVEMKVDDLAVDLVDS